MTTGSHPRLPRVTTSKTIPATRLNPPTALRTVKVSTWLETWRGIMLFDFPGITSTFGNEQAVTEARVSMKTEKLAYLIRSFSEW